MLPYRHMVLHWSRTPKSIKFKNCLSAAGCHTRNSFLKSIFSPHKYDEQIHSSFQNSCPTSFIHTMSHPLLSQPSQSQEQRDKLALISSQMNMRLVNENSFLSWCRNAYLSSVVGIAMMEEAASTLAQTAGCGAFLVGGLNVFWGTGCHLTNLVKLRHASGMSNFTLALHMLGSSFHCILWLLILLCYLINDPNYSKKSNSERTDLD